MAEVVLIGLWIAKSVAIAAVGGKKLFSSSKSVNGTREDFLAQSGVL